MKRNLDAWLPVVGWMIVIVVLTSVQLPRWAAAQGGSHLDKVVHFGLYFGFGLTLGRAARITGLTGALAILGLLVAGIAFAAIDELAQSWVPTRVPQMADWLADVAGLVTAYVAYVAWWKGRWKTEAYRT